MYFLFFFIVLILFMIEYNRSRGDLAEPIVVLLAYYMFMIVLGLYNYEYWHLYEFAPKTVLLLVTELVAFAIGDSAAVRISFFKPKISRRVVVKEEPSRINVHPAVTAFLLIIGFGTLLYFIMYFRRSIGSLRAIAQMLSSYKVYKKENTMPIALNLLIKIVSGLAYSFLFVFIYNATIKQLRRRDFFLLIIPFISILISLLSNARGDCIMMLMAGGVTWYLLRGALSQSYKKNNKIAVKKGVIIVLCASILFWLFIFISRTEEENKYNHDFFSYISSYVSGALSSFDVFIKQWDPVPPRWFGQETFIALNNNLSELFGMDRKSMRFLEFRSYNGYSVTNIYGAVRRFYHDFGYTGVIVFPFIQGFISSKIHRSIRITLGKNPVNFSFFLYAYFFYTIIYFAVDDLFFTSVLSIGGVLKIILLYIGYEIVVKSSLIKFKLS